MIRVLIVEEFPELRDSLTLAINGQTDMTVVGTAENASALAEQVKKCDATLVLMDAHVEDGQRGIQAVRELKRSQESIRVVMMTSLVEMGFVGQARDAGIDSFVYKNVGTDELTGVIRSTFGGYSTYPAPHHDLTGFADLTEEELQILRLVCETKSRREIAAELYLSEGTVKRRISDILAKTGYDSAMKLAVHAVSNGWIVPELN